MTYDLAALGHIVLDYVRIDGRFHGPFIGGPCIYASLAARVLGASVLVISKVGADFGNGRLKWLRSKGIPVQHIRLSEGKTTVFRIRYVGGGRAMAVTSLCSPIGREDVESLPPFRAIHIGPVLNEVQTPIAVTLAKRASIVSLDPQGYFRRLDAGGQVDKTTWWDRRLLRHVDILKLSEDELSSTRFTRKTITALLKIGPEIILLSRGASGSIVLSRENGTFKVPAYHAKVQDPTGAGDALVGAFLVTWMRSQDPLWSAAIGSAVASFVVSKFGPGNFGTPKQVEGRARWILERTVRVR